MAQLYLGEDKPRVERPVRELKGFKRVYLQPGASRRVTLEVDPQELAYWDTGAHRWVIDPGVYRVWVGRSSRDLPLNGLLSNLPCD